MIFTLLLFLRYSYPLVTILSPAFKPLSISMNRSSLIPVLTIFSSAMFRSTVKTEIILRELISSFGMATTESFAG